METIFDQFMALAKQGERDSSGVGGVGGEIVQAVPLPSPRCEVAVREAAPGTDDLAFIDQLQKMHSHMVGFMPRKQLEKYVEDGHVLIAEGAEPRPAGSGAGVDDPSGNEDRAQNPLPDGRGSVGYIIARDQYMKRDDVGIVYQLNVAPLKQRHLIGATLVKAVFERAAYGCKLFCCWCAQDIQANWFWESIGFVPIAFRTGSRAKQRIHIFWQKRIREGDEVTEYWYPHQTSGGAVAEDRIVLPIPPGTHWRDAKPLVLPGVPGVVCDGGEGGDGGEGVKQIQEELPAKLPGGASVKARPQGTVVESKESKAKRVAMVASQSKHLRGTPPGKAAVFSGGGVKYVDRPDYVPELDAPEELKAMERAEEEAKQKEKAKRAAKRPRAKSDPKLVKAARELRDRYLDEVNSGRMLPSQTEARYDVSRQLAPGAPGAPGSAASGECGDAARSVRVSQVSEDRLLDAA
jgi:GNAT superfamily N-acetyltransferase